MRIRRAGLSFAVARNVRPLVIQYFETPEVRYSKSANTRVEWQDRGDIAVGANFVASFADFPQGTIAFVGRSGA